MKKIIYSIYIILIPVFLVAQVRSPYNSLVRDTTLPCGQHCMDIFASYVFAGATDSYTVQPISYMPLAYNSGYPLPLHIDDGWSQSLALPFDFCFFGNVYSNFIVSTNGSISFNVTNAGGFCEWGINGPIPDTINTDMPNSIFGVFQDIDPTYKGAIYVEYGGLSPYRYCKISWDSVPYYGDPNSIDSNITSSKHWASSQIILHETTNIIDIYTRDKDTVSQWNSGLAIEGILNQTGTIAYTAPGRNATAWTAQNEGWRFTPSGQGDYAGIRLYQENTLIDSLSGDSTLTMQSQICPPYLLYRNQTTTYYLKVTYNNCTNSGINFIDSMHVTVLGGPMESQDICRYSSVILSACDSGGVWSTLSGNPSAINISANVASGFDSLGIYSLSYCNGGICDTVYFNVVLHIVTHSFATICGSQTYSFDSHIYNTAGHYVDTLYSATSCDTISILDLGYKVADTVVTYSTICGSQTYNFRGRTYDSPGIYSDTIASANGCDTIYILDLSVIPTVYNRFYDTICIGGYVAFYNQVLTTEGIYSNVLTGANGCDSIILMRLTVDTSTLYVSIIAMGDTLMALPIGKAFYEWYDSVSGTIVATTESFIPTYSGTYIAYAGDSSTCIFPSSSYFYSDTIMSGINSINIGDIKIYPNPTNGIFAIESVGMIGTPYSITNVIGQQLVVKHILGNLQLIDLSWVANGVYILIVGNRTFKIIVSN